jgi:hypothetical protein
VNRALPVMASGAMKRCREDSPVKVGADNEGAEDHEQKMLQVVEQLYLNHHDQVSRPLLKLSCRMRESREVGLARSLPASNRGFQMLLNSGYTGGGLGAQQNGIQEPISVLVRAGKAGLGCSSETTANPGAGSGRAEELSDAALKTETRQHTAAMVDAFKQRQQASQLRAALRIVEDLDRRAGCADGAFMWSSTQHERPGEPEASAPKPPKVPLGSPSEEHNWWVEGDAAMQLAGAAAYLRHAHLYCFWCGQGHPSKAQLLGACPGPMQSDH